MSGLKKLEKLELVPCNSFERWASIRFIRNQPQNRNNFGNTFIGIQEHHAHMKNFHTHYYVCVGRRLEDEKTDYAGFIGCVDGDIRIAVNHEYHNEGIGKWMLMMFLTHVDMVAAGFGVFRGNKVKSKVKKDNAIGQRLFESVNKFEKYDENDEYVFYCLKSEKK